MEAITLTINDQAISARAGKTILQVAREHGIEIPTLCHHDLLRPIGACRLCQVELADRGVVVPSCVTQIAPNMVIQTHSERVIRNRRNIVRLLMAAHPESCVVCEKGNRCELRSLAAKLGVGEHGLDPMPYHPGVQDLNPFLARDLSKCILCAKCIRADQEVVAEGVIDYNKRGFDAHPATLEALPLAQSNCTFCGTCLSVCPTGAIFEKHKPRLDHAGARTESVCGFCACGCSIYLEHDHSQVIGVAPTAKEGTANGIGMCVKGHFGFDHLLSPERLNSPLKKTAEGFQPVSWDEALALVAKGLGDAAQKHGPASVGILGGDRMTNEECYLLQKLGRAVIGTPNLDSPAGAYARSAREVMLTATGFAAGTLALKDLAKSEVVVVLGADPTSTAPVVAYHLKRAVRAGAKLLLIDPLQGKLAKWAHLWLRPSPGGDTALMAAILKVLAEEDLVDHKFVGVKTRDYAKLEAALAGLSPEVLARAAGEKLGKIREAAALVGKAGTVSFLFGRGAMQQPRSRDLASLIMDLLLATGNLGREGAGILPIYTDCNSQGALDMGLDPTLLPGHRPADDRTARAELKSLWGVETPSGPGLGTLEMLAAAGDGLKAMLVMATNPAGEMPDAARVRRGLESLEFLAVSDMFLSETAKLADVVLPLEGFAEKDGTFTSLERRVQRLKAAVPPPGGFPPAWQVLVRLAADLGGDWSYDSPAAVMAEIEAAVPLYRGVAGVLARGRQVAWPLPGVEDVTDTLPHAIGHPDGRAAFLAPDLGGLEAPTADKNYPFLLMQGHILPHLGGGLRTSHSKRLALAAPAARLGLSPGDYQAMGLNGDGGRVVVASPLGELTLEAVSDERLPAGVAFLPACHPGLGHNALFAHDWEHAGGKPAAKTARAAIRKA